MKVTKSQKIFIGLLCAGMAALAYDRLGGPSVAEAVDAVSAAAGGSAEAGATPSAPAGEPRSLSQTLRGLLPDGLSPEGTRDAFAPPASWFPVIAPPPPPPTQPAPPDDRAERFHAAHTLRAVLRSGGQGQVLVDGSLVRVGQTLDGLRLLEVRPMQAVFGVGPLRVTLDLSDGTKK